MNVLLLTKYDQSGASSRYRTLQYLNYLKNRGINVTVNSLLDSSYIEKIFARKKISFLYYVKRYFLRLYFLLFKIKKNDLVWVEGELFPYIPFFIEKFLLPSRYVVEYDDAIYHNYDMHKKSLVRKLFANKIKNIMKKSSHVIVGNDYVKEYAEKAGANKITTLPTVVDATVYAPSEINHDNDEVTIGWLGSPTTVKYMRLIDPVLKSIAQKTNVRLSIIGGEYQVDGIKTSYHHWPDKWSQAEEIDLLNKIDIGVMPLIDSPWERGKCGFKLIKYMACAKPIIASPVSMNNEIVQHGINGYLADTLAEWEEYLLNLINDAALRKKYGESGRKYMMDRYSLQATAPVIFSILEASAKTV